MSHQERESNCPPLARGLASATCLCYVTSRARSEKAALPQNPDSTPQGGPGPRQVFSDHSTAVPRAAGLALSTPPEWGLMPRRLGGLSAVRQNHQESLKNSQHPVQIQALIFFRAPSVRAKLRIYPKIKPKMPSPFPHCPSPSFLWSLCPGFHSLCLARESSPVIRQGFEINASVPDA